jgi:hypothetical protein
MILPVCRLGISNRGPDSCLHADVLSVGRVEGERNSERAIDTG